MDATLNVVGRILLTVLPRVRIHLDQSWGARCMSRLYTVNTAVWD